MPFEVNTTKLESGPDFGPKELHHIEAGMHQARLVSYIELGMHIPMFMGKPAVFGKNSKRCGQGKPPELVIMLTFEFPLCEHSNPAPLTIKTSIPWQNGEFINKLAVSEALMTGNLSMTHALKTGYMKYLIAMNAACATDHKSLAAFVGTAFLIQVTNKLGTKADDNGNIPVYANMVPGGIQGTMFKNPVTNKMERVDVPPTVGTYIPVFSWDAPVLEDYEKLPKYVQDAMKSSVDFPESTLAALLAEVK